MVLKKSYRKNRNQKKHYKRTFNQNLYKSKSWYSKTAVQKVPRSVSDSQIVVMPYAEAITMTGAGGGIPAEFFYRCNSIFDPNATGVGHQPLGKIEWGFFYNHYVVLSSMIEVTLTSQGATTADQGYLSVYTQDLNTASTTYLLNIENSRFKPKCFGAIGAGNATVVAKAYYDTKRFFGVKDVRDNIAHLGALMTASPQEEAFFRIHVDPITASTTLGTVSVLVRIWYKVLLTEVKQLGQS